MGKVGYNTDYIGQFEIKGLGHNKAYGLNVLSAMCGEDCRDHPEWKPAADNLTYLNFEVTGDKLEWDGSEKSYDMAAKLNFITKYMRTHVSGTFHFDGEFLCQGEDATDRYYIKIDSTGMAHEVPITELATGDKVKCPNCFHEFELE